MATRANHDGRAPALPLNLIAQAVPRLTRNELEALTERLIERLDEIDGNPDHEDDDPAGHCDEDGVNTSSGVFSLHGRRLTGPGCYISEDGI